MNCGFSRDQLALYVENDLPADAGALAARHLASCAECRQFCEELRASQTLLKSLRQETADSTDCLRMRRDVMALVAASAVRQSWALRIERALMLGMRRRSYAFAAVVLVAGISASLMAKVPHAGDTAGATEVAFTDGNTLLRPNGYREWIALGGDGHAGTHRAYVNPASYREYERTGTFPDGTVIVRESGDDETSGPHAASTLLALVRDTRVKGGIAFFDFSSTTGPAAKAEALPESRGCRNCHRNDRKA